MRLIASLLLAAVAIAPCDVSANDVNPFVPESIVEKQTTSGANASCPSTRRRGGSCSQLQGSQVCACTSSQAASPHRGKTAQAHIGTILVVRPTST